MSAAQRKPVSGPHASSSKAMYRKLDAALATIERIDNTSEMLERILESLLSELRAELGFEAGRIYKREGEDFYLCCALGRSRGATLGLRVPSDYLPHRRTLKEGVVIVRPREPGFDAQFERSIGVDSTFAAIAVGEGNTYVVALSIRGRVKEQHVLSTLTTVRHVINLKLEQRRIGGMLEESRLIQESLLPSSPPEFSGYDIDGRSRPSEIVGGDVFDYLPLSDRLMGIAVADVSGHGFPAALLARDVVTGLRVGARDGVKVETTIERLNQVIHRAALSSKFVSLFYGELAGDGTLTYCNAGHNPPLVRRARAFSELGGGGMVLGPVPGARYESAQVRLEPGDLVVAYTDGLVEREDRQDRPFGKTRLKRVLRELEGASARETVDAVFEAADAHGGGRPQNDDVTVVVARRT